MDTAPAPFDLFAFEQRLEAEIYGGVEPDERSVQAYLQAIKLSGKVHLISIRCDVEELDLSAFSFCERFYALHLHTGLVYLLYTGKPAVIDAYCRARGLLCGRAIPLELGAFLRTFQRAIISMREVELKPLRKSGGAPLSLSIEMQTRSLAVQAVRGGDLWRPAVRVWLEIVLLRHETMLNSARRRIVEFFALLTRDLDQEQRLSNAFRRATLSVYNTFAYSELEPRVFEAIDELAPLVLWTREEALRQGRPRSETVDAALIYLRNRFYEPIGLSEVAAAVKVSPAHLSRLFKKEVGQHLTAYLQVLRIGQAREILNEEEVPLKTIALRCGFPTLEHFFRTFRKLAGISPNAYRKSQRI